MSLLNGRLSSIRWRLIAATVAIVALGQLIMGLVQADQEAAQLREDARNNALALLKASVETLAVPLANRDLPTLDSALARLAENRDQPSSERSSDGPPKIPLLWISVLNQEGKVVAHTDPAHYGEIWSERPLIQQSVEQSGPVVREVEDTNGSRLQLAIPIESGLRWGTAVTEVSMVDVESAIEARRHRVLVQSLILGLTITALLTVLMGLLVIQPLLRFSEAAKQIGTGDLSARVHLDRPVREWKQMSEIFNEMAQQIEGQTQVLEQQVASRTEELQEVNRALEEAVEQLREQARTDGLTGLFNHRSFQEVLNLEVKRSQRHGQPLSLMMIDVDHFKTFNDAHGHPAGDEVLKGMAKVLRQSLRETDTVARYGGEEFSAIIVNTDGLGAEAAGQKVLQAVRSTLFPGEETSQPSGKVTVSIGIANLPIHATDSAALVEAADQALYAAKRAGRNQMATAPTSEVST